MFPPLDNLRATVLLSPTVACCSSSFQVRQGRLQLVDQVKVAAASGAIQRDPLPGIRPLAERAPRRRNTVAKAYAELENQNVIETLPARAPCARTTRRSKGRRRRLLAGDRRAVGTASRSGRTVLRIAEQRFDAGEQASNEQRYRTRIPDWQARHRIATRAPLRRTDVDGLNLRVAAGRCYGFFGRTAPQDDDDQVPVEPAPDARRGSVFSIDRRATRWSQIARVVPDSVGLPRMTVGDARLLRVVPAALERDTESAARSVPSICGRGRAICRRGSARSWPSSAAPGELLGSRPTSGLDPIVRPVHPGGDRRLPGQRAWKTHGVRLDTLISEFEG